MALKFVYVLSFIDIFQFGLLVPLIRRHVFALGASPLVYGILESIQALISFITGPIAGSFSDTNGRKFVLIITLAVNLISYIFLGSSNTLLIFIISRIIFAFSNKVQILAKAIVADNVPKENQTSVYGKLGALAALGFITSPVIGGYFYQKSNDFSVIAPMLSSLTLLSIGIVVFLPEKNKQRKQTKIKKFEGLRKVIENFKNLKWNHFWDIFLFKFLSECCFLTFYATLGIVLIEKFNASQVEVGYVLSLHALLMIVGNLGVEKFKNKFYNNDSTGAKQNLHGFFLLTLSFIGFYSAPNFSTYIFFIIPLSFIRALFDSTWMKILLGRTPEEQKGSVMGAYESLMPLAGFIAPLIMGLSTEIFGDDFSRLICIGPTVIACLLCLKLKDKNIKIK